MSYGYIIKRFFLFFSFSLMYYHHLDILYITIQHLLNILFYFIALIIVLDYTFGGDLKLADILFILPLFILPIMGVCVSCTIPHLIELIVFTVTTVIRSGIGLILGTFINLYNLDLYTIIVDSIHWFSYCTPMLISLFLTILEFILLFILYISIVFCTLYLFYKLFIDFFNNKG